MCMSIIDILVIVYQGLIQLNIFCHTYPLQKSLRIVVHATNTTCTTTYKNIQAECQHYQITHILKSRCFTKLSVFKKLWMLTFYAVDNASVHFFITEHSSIIFWTFSNGICNNAKMYFSIVYRFYSPAFSEEWTVPGSTHLSKRLHICLHRRHRPRPLRPPRPEGPYAEAPLPRRERSLRRQSRRQIHRQASAR